MRAVLIVAVTCMACFPAYSNAFPGSPAKKSIFGGSANSTGSQPLSCTCNDEICNCCAKFQVPKLKLSQIGCLQITSGKLKSGYTVGFTVNGTSVWKQQYPGKIIPPICIAIPQFPVIRICLVISDIKFENGTLHMCPQVEVKLVPGSFTLLVISLDCVEIGKEGITFVPSCEPSSILGFELNKGKPS